MSEVARARLGQVLRGKYRLDRVIGIGGMATVYAATHRNKKRFAIKMLHPELSIRGTIRTRFLREGYVANSVENAGAVAVLDDDVAEDGSAFLVMELLVGRALDELMVQEAGTVPLDVVVAIADALLEVLAAEHTKGVVHRDIKPANLFLTDDGRLEVLDFGIARLQDETSGPRRGRALRSERRPSWRRSKRWPRPARSTQRCVIDEAPHSRAAAAGRSSGRSLRRPAGQVSRVIRLRAWKPRARSHSAWSGSSPSTSSCVSSGGARI